MHNETEMSLLTELGAKPGRPNANLVEMHYSRNE